MSLTKKQRVFIEEYLQCWNATEAAKRADYAHPNAQGNRLLLNVSISDAIEKRISEKAMSADEVLLRLGDMARGDLADFMDISRMNFDLSLQRAEEAGKTHLIKKIKQTTKYTKDDEEITTQEIELYDAQAALVHLGKHHKVFTDNLDITSRGKSFVEDKEEWEIERQKDIEAAKKRESECGTDL